MAGGGVMSNLRAELDNYLAIRRAVGFKLHRTGLLLADFVGYLEESQSDTITTDSALAWASLPQNGSSEWWGYRLSAGAGVRSSPPCHRPRP